MRKTNWVYFPKSHEATTFIKSVVAAFEAVEDDLNVNAVRMKSDSVLAAIRPGPQQIGFEVETGKKGNEKIRVPVLFGQNG